jgi:hypothetical protein
MPRYALSAMLAFATFSSQVFAQGPSPSVTPPPGRPGPSAPAPAPAPTATVPLVEKHFDYPDGIVSWLCSNCTGKYR